MLASRGLASPRPFLDGRGELARGYTYELSAAYRLTESRAQAECHGEGKAIRSCFALGRYDGACLISEINKGIGGGAVSRIVRAVLCFL